MTSVLIVWFCWASSTFLSLARVPYTLFVTVEGAFLGLRDAWTRIGSVIRESMFFMSTGIRFLWLLRVSEVVTIAIVSVFRKWVSNNRIYLRANQHTKLAKVRTPRTLRWFPDSSRWRTKYSGLSWSVEPMSALETIQCEVSFFSLIFYNICFSQLSYFVSDRPDERLHGSISASRSIFTTNFETWFDNA